MSRLRRRASCHIFNLSLLALLLGLSSHLYAGTISGTITDQSGAVISGAQIEIRGGDLTQPLSLTSDGLGRFASPDLKPGKYTLRISREGFEPLEETIDLTQSVDLQLHLKIPTQETKIVVPGQAMAYANSEPVYRELRSGGLGETFQLNSFTLKYDVGTFQFEKGTLTWLAPVEGVVTGAVFVGEGH